MTQSYCHLHLHSEYSTADAINRVKDIPKRVKELSMPSVALTDHGTMAGAKKFFDACYEENVKPILGIEMYMAPGSRHDKKAEKRTDSSFHFLVLAQNLQGYKNLVTLNNLAYTEGFYYKPRIDMDLLTSHSEGLICTTACLGGGLTKLDELYGREHVETWVQDLKALLGDRFFLELQANGIDRQATLNSLCMDLSNKFSIPLVGTNDVHFSVKGQHALQHMVTCIGHHETVSHSRYPPVESIYIKSPDEMAEAFTDFGDLPLSALANSQSIADMCDSDYFKSIRASLPKFPGITKLSNEVLSTVAGWGLIERFKKLNIEAKDIPQEYKTRLNHELKVIDDLKFSDYFLIVWDYVQHARNSGIRMSPGRGSVAGSVVAWALKIHDVDPIKYDLFFERFLNVGRSGSSPDIDLDFDPERVDEVVNYISTKYGPQQTARIGTYGTFSGKGSTKDFARVLGFSPMVGSEISNLIPDPVYGKNIPMKDVIKEQPELLKKYPEVINSALAVDGMVKQNGQHACAEIIYTPEDINIIPLYTTSKCDYSITQWDKNDLESIGVIKFDLLALDNLSIVDQCLRLIKQDHGIDIDVDTIPLNDKKTYELISTGELAGVFQLESDGMSGLCTKVKPKTIGDIAACNAIWRPGPIESGMLEQYVTYKQTKVIPKGIHPKLKPIIASTGYVPIYQEQVMKLAEVLAGYTLQEADDLRAAIGKKKASAMAKHKTKFVDGLKSISGFKDREALKMWEDLEGWCNYGFGAGHSYAYSLLSYQTAYLKANYLGEFLTALLAVRFTKSERFPKYLALCRHYGYKVSGIDINHSVDEFKLVGNTILFSLTALKGVGAAATKSFLSARGTKAFESIEDFIARIDRTTLDRGVIKVFIAAGAFDSLGYNRNDLLNSIDEVIDYHRQLAHYHERLEQYHERNAENEQLLALGQKKKVTRRMPELPDQPHVAKNKNKITLDLLNAEFQVLGTYASAHPCDFIQTDSDITRLEDIDFSNNSKSGPVDVKLTIPNIKPEFTNKYNSVVNAEIDLSPCKLTINNKLYESLKDIKGMILGLANVSVTNGQSVPPKVKLNYIDILFPKELTQLNEP